MKVLLTGATGYLGSYLLEEFLESGFEVSVFKRSFSNVHRIDKFINEIRTYDIDYCNIDQPFKDNGKFDVVVHTATLYGRRGESSHEIFKANIDFPLKLLETACRFNTGSFLNSDTILHKFLNAYSLSKSQFVDWGKQFSLMKSIQFNNIKLEHIYGPGDDESKFTTRVIKECLANVPEMLLTEGKQKRDFIYIDDVVSAYKVIVNKLYQSQDFFNEYQLGTGQSVSIKEFVETVHSLSKSQTILKFGMLPYRDNELMESAANIERIKGLGWKPKVQIEDGIIKVIQREQS